MKKVTAAAGFIDTMSAMRISILGGSDAVPGRDDVFRDELDGIIVDTVAAFDTGAWETGIERDGKPWAIVEQYDDRGAAQVGHEKWVALLKADRHTDLPRLMLWD